MIGYGNSVFLRRSTGPGIPPVDPDAQAFITAAAITDPTQQAAINTLVVDLKGYNVWTKMKALYPMVGGTASQHKFNLKNPLDTDAAFRLQFNGGITHSNLGSLGNGLNGYALSYLNSLTQLTNSNLHFSWYTRNASNLSAFSNEIVTDAAYVTSPFITFRTNNKISGNAYFSAGDDNIGATVSNTQSGFILGSETASNLRKIYRNGSVIATNTTNDTTALPNANLSLWGGLIFINYSGNNCAFASIGNGLTDTESANFYTAVQAFQTTLGRQV